VAELNSDFAFIARFLPPCVTPLLDALCLFSLPSILIAWLEIYYNQAYWAKIAGRLLQRHQWIIFILAHSIILDGAYEYGRSSGTESFYSLA